MILNLHSRIPMIHFYLRPLTASLGLGSWEVINDPYVSRIISFSLLSPSLILSVTISPDDHPLLGIQQTFIEGLLCARHCVKSQGNESPLRSSYFTGEAGMYISNYSGVWWVQRGSMVWTFKKQREWDGEHQPVRAREAGISSFRENPSLKYEFKDWKFALQIMWETRHSQKRRDSI